MALAFDPSASVYTTDTVLSSSDQIGTVTVSSADVNANGVSTQNATNGSEDYISTSSQTVSLNTAFNIDTLDDYISDNNERFTVSIDAGSYGPATGGYENVSIDTTVVTTTIKDDTGTPSNTPDGPEDDKELTKIVLIAVNNSTDTVSDIPVDVNGALIIDNENTVSESEDFYYIAVAVDSTGKAVDIQDGTVDVSYTNVSTSNSDYTISTTTVNIGSTFKLDANDDYLNDNNEVLNLTISNPLNTSYENVEVDSSNNKVISTITDQSGVDTPAGEEDTVYAIITGPGTVIEGVVTTDYTVSLVDKDNNSVSVDAGKSVVVNITYGIDSDALTSNAISGVDYTNGVASVTITNGSSSTLDVTTIEDYFNELDETLRVSISGINDVDSSFEKVSLGDKNGNQTFVDTVIVDNEPTGTPDEGARTPEDTIYAVISGDTTVYEGNKASYTVTLVDKDGNAVNVSTNTVVTLSYTNGTAVGANTQTAIDGSEDYSNSNTSITILANESSSDFTADAFDDYLSDNNQTYTVGITNVASTEFENIDTSTGVTGKSASVETTIKDSTDGSNPTTDGDQISPFDTVYVKITGDDSTTEVNGNTLTHTIFLVDKDNNPVILPSGKSVTVTLSYVTDDTSSADFSTKLTTLTITGTNTGNVVNVVADDSLIEGVENYRLEITGVSDDNSVFENLEIHSSDYAVAGTITDDVSANDDAAIAKEDTTLSASGNVLSNDEVGSGVSSTLTTSSTGTYGTLVLNTDGSYIYTLTNGTDGTSSTVQNLSEGQIVTDTFTYTVDGGTTTADLIVTVTGKNDAPVITLDNDSSSAASGANYETSFQEGGTAISIADTDTIITDIDDTNIESAKIVLTNALDGDDLNTPTIAGLTFVKDISVVGKITVTITGSKTLAEYQDAIEQITYINSSATPNETDRIIEVTVNDGNDDSNTAITTIKIDATPDLVDDVENVDEGGVTITNVSENYNLLDNDDLGTPTGNITSFTYTDEANTVQTVNTFDGSANALLDTKYGTLTLNADGTWTYTSDAQENHGTLTDTITYTVSDNNADTDTATFTITVNDTIPTADKVFNYVQEDDLSTGTDLSKESLILNDTDGDTLLNIHKQADDITDVAFSSDTTTALTALAMKSDGDSLTYALSNSNHTVTASAGGREIFTLTLNNTADASGATQSYTFELKDRIDHDEAGVTSVGNYQDFTFDYVLTDTDSTTDQSFVVRVIDDTVIAIDDVQQSAVENSNTVLTGDVKTNDLGADKDYKIYDFKYTDTSNVLQTLDFSSLTTHTVNTLAGELTVNQNGTWSFTANRVVDNSSDSNKGTFLYRLIDEDGDVSNGFPLNVDGTYATQPIVVTDTIPTANPVDSVVDEKNLFSLTGSASTEGADLDNSDANIFDDDIVSTTSQLNLAVTGTDAITDVQFSGVATGPITGLTSDGKQITYGISGDGHTLTATRAGDGATVFVLTLKDTASTGAYYDFVLSKAIDHNSSDQGPNSDGRNLHVLDFSIDVTDNDGSNLASAASFNVTIIDSIPNATPATIVMNEDDIGDLQGDGAGVTITLSETISGDITIDGSTLATSASVNIKENGSTQDIGTLTNNGNGTVTFVATADYSGTPSFTYTVEDADGDTASGTVNITVTPVTDTPTITVSNINIIEDNANTEEGTYAVSLGLALPVITDEIDETEADSFNDEAERFGLISLSEIPDGVKITQTDGTTVIFTGTSGDNDVTIFINDVAQYHHTGVTAGSANLSLTQAEFESLKFIHVEDDASDFTIDVSATAYEVDDAGAIRGSVTPVTTTETINIDVLAATDPVTLIFNDGDGAPGDGSLDVDSDNQTYSEYVNEDSWFDIDNILDHTIADNDTSETYTITVSSMPDGSTLKVDGVNHSIGGSGEYTFTLSNKIIPDIQYKAPSNFSGDITGISIKLVAHDTDSDSSHSDSSTVSTTTIGNTTIYDTEDEVILNLYVKPIADDVTLPDVSTAEDTAIKLFENIALTDTDGTEEITQIVINNLLNSWVLKDHNGNILLTGDGSTDQTIDVTSVSLTNVKNYTVTPPAHSSSDMALSVDITVKDEKTVKGSTETDTDVFNHTLNITVTPKAELVLGTSDDANADDVTINPNHAYAAALKEDTWFDLGSTFNTENGNQFEYYWTNEDDSADIGNETHTTSQTDSEETFAHLTLLTDNSGDFTDGAETVVSGGKFKYNDGSTDIEINNSSSGVDIPVAYLDTLEFIAPDQYSGSLKIKIEAKTVDYDEDTNASDTATSGEAYLRFDVDPVADTVTLQVAQASGNEDAGRTNSNDEKVNADTIDAPLNGINLTINPSSDDTDGSETFTITIEGIPDAGSMYYNGTLFDKDTASAGALTITNTGTDSNGGSAWQVVITNFDKTADLTFIPPHNSDANYTFDVSGFSVDGASNTSLSPVSLQIDVDVKGVADIPINDDLATVTVNDDTTTARTFNATTSEDSAAINLKTIFATPATLDSYDSDSSETLTLKVTNLESGFDLQGATLITGTGTSRIWFVEISELNADNVTLSTPSNFAGETNFDIQFITTETEGDSKTHAVKNVSLFVTPATDASTIVTSDSQNEDQMSKVLDFGFSTTDTDALNRGKETLTSFGIDMSTVDSGVVLTGSVSGVLSGAGYIALNVTGSGVLETVTATLPEDKHMNGSYDFNIQYTYEDKAIDDDSNEYTVSNSVTNQLYTVNVSAITDDIDLTTATITTANNSVDGSGNVTATDNGIFTKTLNIVGLDSDGRGAVETDSSEEFTRVTVSGVPEGITVGGVHGVYAGDTGGGNYSGFWYVDIPNEDIDGSTSYDLTFDVDGSFSGSQLNTAYPITITAYNEDNNNGSEQNDSETFNLTITQTITGTNGTPAAIIDFYQDIDNDLTQDHDNAGMTDTDAYALSILREDTTFILADVVYVDTDHTTSGNTDFSITIKNVPVGVTIDGMTYNSLDGGFYTLSGNGNETAIVNALQAINVTPISNDNTDSTNILATDLAFDIELTTYAVGGSSNSAIINFTASVLPVTDPMTLTVVNDGTTLEDIDQTFSITLDNVADASNTQIIDGKVYLKMTESFGDIQGTDGISGTLTDGVGGALATEVNPSGLAAGTYFVISGVSYNDTLDFIYSPAEDRNGSVNVDVYVKNIENESWTPYNTSELLSSKTITFDVTSVIDGFDLTSSANRVGDEDTLIDLEVSFSNPDSSESLTSVSLDKVPDGFLIFYGDLANGSDKVLAQNVGDNGTTSIEITYGTSSNVVANLWNIPLNAGVMPSYVWLQAPENWSGTIPTMQVNVIDSSGAITSSNLNVVVSPIVDTLTLSTTKTFGDELDDIELKLNANVQDLDGSETVKLEIKDLGAGAFFKINGIDVPFVPSNTNNTEDVEVAYNSGTDTYTLQNIAAADINSVTFIQSAVNTNVTATATMVEENGTSSDIVNSTPVVGTVFNVQIDAVLATSGADSLLYSGNAINANAGEDSLILGGNINIDFDLVSNIDNIEKIDLTKTGEHDISNLGINDVIGMTDGDNILEILGDSGDSVSLKNADGGTWEQTGTSGGFDEYSKVGDNTALTLKIDNDIITNII